MPREALAALHGARGLATALIVKLRDPGDLETVRAGLAAAYRRYLVRETLSVAEIREFSSRITTPFRLMVAFVLLMSIFIVYSSFKVIATERQPVIGTFRSVGATRLATGLVLLAEGLAYGLIGGLAGCAAGIGVLHLMARLTAPGWMRGVPVTVSFAPGQLLQSFLLAVLLCLAGALLPVLRLSRLPIRAVILGQAAEERTRSRGRVPAGLAILAAALVLPRFVPRAAALPVNTTLLLSTLVAAVLLVPAVTGAAVRLLRRAWPVLLGNVGLLAAQNLRRDPGALNNITLLAIGISSLLLINTLGGSVEEDVAGFYRKARFQIWMWAGQADRRLEGRLRGVPGVTGTLGVYSVDAVPVTSHGARIELLQGMGRHMADWWDLETEGDPQALRGKLEDGRGILVTTVLQQKLGLRAGDALTLQTTRGPRDYRVAGFFRSLMQNGMYALVSERNLRMDFKQVYYGNIYVRAAGDGGEAARAIERRLGRQRTWIRTVDQLAEENRRSNEQTFLVLRGFSLMVLLIAVVGVFNNFVVSFLARRRSLAVLYSVGMSRAQGVRTLLIEAGTGGLIGGLVGVGAGFLLLLETPAVLRAVNLSVNVHWSWRASLASFLAGVLLSVLAAASPALRSARLNIIQAVRYE